MLRLVILIIYISMILSSPGTALATQGFIKEGVRALSSEPNYPCRSQGSECYGIVDYLPVGTVLEYDENQTIYIIHLDEGSRHAYVPTQCTSGTPCYILKKQIKDIGNDRYLIVSNPSEPVKTHTLNSSIDNQTCTNDNTFSYDATAYAKIIAEENDFYIIEINNVKSKVMKRYIEHGYVKLIDKNTARESVTSIEEQAVADSFRDLIATAEERITEKIPESLVTTFFSFPERLLCLSEAAISAESGFKFLSNGLSINFDFELLQKDTILYPQKVSLRIGNKHLSFFSISTIKCEDGRPKILSGYYIVPINNQNNIFSNTSSVFISNNRNVNKKCKAYSIEHVRMPYIIHDHRSYTAAYKNIKNQTDNSDSFLDNQDTNLRDQIYRYILLENSCFTRTEAVK
ncbi:hypothetical protein G3N56_06390 [Desulfovibrio sulfodismutans]|uniref:SH3 domain-containing protein n=1 Tax=Desulfolutivibrio sulfodismutans TaxID=63561 RepID=A0A7K3NJJ1_9BACT|nr:hypothetical protein [Desulfolutivibrio sulfodismutans]NDY56371.1 hypothetical protein [Desulfolutivibrio sulfodismutans]QLA13458.1 hypothetical protein GD606_14895 [Desulfolutivibrio sulfodismutans DSM 3696]